MKLVYIAGPYSARTQIEVEQNVATAITAGNKIAEAGFAVFIPHLYQYWEKWYHHDYKFWIEQDLEMLSRCDVVVRLDGHSLGADKEVKNALIIHNIPVYFGVQELLDCAR
jgi:hypothetical protein